MQLNSKSQLQSWAKFGRHVSMGGQLTEVNDAESVCAHGFQCGGLFVLLRGPLLLRET